MTGEYEIQSEIETLFEHLREHGCKPRWLSDGSLLATALRRREEGQGFQRKTRPGSVPNRGRGLVCAAGALW